MSTNDVRVEIYRSFTEEVRAPHAQEIAARLRLPQDEVMVALRELAAGDVIAFVPGTERLWLAHPFCAIDAPFKVSSVRGNWNAICIWDALGILALIESDGDVSTVCPDCGEVLNVSVVDGGVEGPPDAVVHFGVPARLWYEDVAYT